MSREALLKISKELADYIINGKSTTLRKEHYFMLSISKFIITKERLIQTDSDGKILYFDDTDDNKRTINKFYKLIKDRFSFTMDNNDISSDTFNNVVLSSGKEDSELKRKVYIINKLRDSLAHGRYRFDTASDSIIVENDYEVNSHHYSFTCSVEPELLEVLALTPKEVDKALKQYERGNNSYNYFITLANSILNMKEKIDFESNTYTKDERKELESLYEIALSDIDKLITKKRQTITKLAEIDNHPTTNKTISTNISKNDINITKDYIEDELIEKISSALIAMASIIDKHNKVNSIQTAVVYNYLCLLFSEREELDFRYLKSPSSKVYFKKINEKNGENDITGTLGRLKRSIKIFNRKYQEAQKSPEDIKKNTMRQLIINLYNETMEAFENRNRCIYNRIRNGIMHCTIESKGKKIVIKDSSDHNMDNPSFIIEATTKELLDYAKCIEDKNSQEEFTLKDFISELYMAGNNYGINVDQIKRFFDNLSKCLLCVDKSTKLNDKTDDIKDKLTNMSTQGYLEDITKLRDILLQRKEELEGKSPSM
ncbi:hypothetical protein L3K73_12560 [Holdemanella sp. SCCA2]|nr:hypothetical protein [Holdemanella sp. SCCA2]